MGFGLVLIAAAHVCTGLYFWSAQDIGCSLKTQAPQHLVHPKAGPALDVSIVSERAERVQPVDLSPEPPCLLEGLEFEVDVEVLDPIDEFDGVLIATE